MKLRMIAESGSCDHVSREQTAKNLVQTSLTKLRNMLEPMGLLQDTAGREQAKTLSTSHAKETLSTSHAKVVEALQGAVSKANEAVKLSGNDKMVVDAATALANVLKAKQGQATNQTGQHRVKSPVQDPAINRAFQLLRDTVRTKTTVAGKYIINGGQSTKGIEEFWGFQIPTSWHDVHAGQAGRATADGIFDQWIRDAVAQAQEVPEENLEAKAKILGELANLVFNKRN